MKKLLLALVVAILVLPTATKAASCFAGGANGVCSDSTACGTSSSWYNVYSPVNACLGSGNGCCVPKTTGSVSCVAGGGNGVCSDSGSCNSSTSNWYNAYSPVNACLGSGSGCCVPKIASGGATGESPLCGDDNLGVKTAIGCLMAGNPKELISQLLGWGVTVGGGIAFLMIVLAGFQMTTAGGDPKKVQAARELLVSAISGLVLIALSIVVLNFIGVSVLGLDNLGFKF